MSNNLTSMRELPNGAYRLANRYWGEDAAVMGKRLLSGLDRWQVRKHHGEWCAFSPGQGLIRWPFPTQARAFRFAVYMAEVDPVGKIWQ